MIFGPQPEEGTRRGSRTIGAHAFGPLRHFFVCRRLWCGLPCSWQGNQARRELAAAVIVGILVVRGTRCFAGFVLGPESSGERIIPLTLAGARYFYEGAARIALVAGVVILTGYLIGIWSENGPDTCY